METEEEENSKARESILNRALFILGQDKESLEQLKYNDLKENLFDTVYRNLLASYNWGFAKKYTELPLWSDETQTRFKYKYEVPGDFIRLREVYSTINENNAIADYDLINNFVYVNSDSCFIAYTRFIEERFLKHEFKEFLAYSIASELIYNYTGDEQNLQQIVMMKKEEAKQLAVSVDTIQKAPTYLSDYNPLIDCRR